MLIYPQALIWLRESTWTVICYCLKSGRLVPISCIILQWTSDELTTSSNVKTCCWV